MPRQTAVDRDFTKVLNHQINGEGWNTDPFTPTESGDRVYGRGAMDMKGGLAAILETLKYFSQHKDEFTGKIIGCFVADEEVLSHGTYQLISEGLNADYAIMAECRYDNVAIGFRGRYSFNVTNDYVLQCYL